MKRKLVIVLCFVTVLLFGTSAGAKDAIVVPPGEKAVVRVYYPDRATGNQVIKSFEAQLLETDYGRGYHVMKVDQETLDRLTDAGLRVEIDSEWAAGAVVPSEAITGIDKYPCYRTVEETFAAAEAIVRDYPKLAEWIDAGDSWEKTAGPGGYDMMVLRLTNKKIRGEKPVLFVTAAMHAREYATAELVTRFAEYLVENYDIDPDVTWVLDHHEIHLMLHTNPDGRKQAETGLSWRKNTNADYCEEYPDRRGADLNRNFAFNWNCCGGSSGEECNATYRGYKAASEPETQTVQTYMDSIFPDQRDEEDPYDRETRVDDDATGIYIDVHAYGNLVLWPWGATPDPAPNAAQLQTLGRKFAYFNDYSPEQAFGLYPTDGTSDGHGYGTLGVASYCFEVGVTFFQPCKYFEKFIVPENLPALLYAAKVVRTPYMTPAGPDVIGLALSSDRVSAGTPVTLTAVADDTRYQNSNGDEPSQAIAAAEYYVDVPPWNEGAVAAGMDASDGGFDAAVENVEATIDTTGWKNGKHIVFVRAQDQDGNWGAVSAVFMYVYGS